MVFYQRNLPHIHPDEAILFITFRLAGSLPAHIVAAFKEEQELKLIQLKNKGLKQIDFKDQQYNLQKIYFGKFDHLLNKGETRPLWLADDNIAKVVADKIHSFDRVRYDLICYCIRIISYILENPLNAGLVKDWHDWKWTYCNSKYCVL